MISLSRKRSVCASDSGYVPSCSIGFCVAITRNTSCGIRYVTPPIVTCRSCIASSIADCVFALERLISSSRTKLAKTGPKIVSNFPDS